METIIYGDKLGKIFSKNSSNQKVAVHDVTIEIQKNDFVAIMGPSGSGKTTLLNIISTISDYDSGKLSILGQDIYTISEKDKANIRKHEIGFIFQEYNLLDTLTIRENINFASALNSEEVDEQYLLKIMDMLNITEVLDKYPDECSGGQQQRASIARALIRKPKIIFADEPTGNLDVNNTREFMNILARINSEENTTVIMVTHDCAVASYTNRVYFLLDGSIKMILDKKDRSKEVFYKEIVKTNTILELE